MYGSVARIRVKAGMSQKVVDILREAGAGFAPGQIAAYFYQTDADSQEFYAASIFESREAYHANAASPEQHQRFMKLMEVLEAEPEWHDGEIVHYRNP